jgi:hypothetical protein
MDLKSEMQVSQKRSEPLHDVHVFVAGEHWDAIKALAKSRDITAAEVVRRLIAAELRKTAKSIPVPF